LEESNNYLSKIITAGDYNESYDVSFTKIKNHIILHLFKIYADNDATWFLNSEKEIEVDKSMLKFTPEEDFDKIINKEIFEKDFWLIKTNIFTSMGFIKKSNNGLSMKCNYGIQFINLICGKFNFCVTKNFNDMIGLTHNLTQNLILCFHSYPTQNSLKIHSELEPELKLDFDTGSTNENNQQEICGISIYKNRLLNLLTIHCKISTNFSNDKEVLPIFEHLLESTMGSQIAKLYSENIGMFTYSNCNLIH
jgi:hypothetical protein